MSHWLVPEPIFSAFRFHKSVQYKQGTSDHVCAVFRNRLRRGQKAACCEVQNEIMFRLYEKVKYILNSKFLPARNSNKYTLRQKWSRDFRVLPACYLAYGSNTCQWKRQCSQNNANSNQPDVFFKTQCANIVNSRNSIWLREQKCV